MVSHPRLSRDGAARRRPDRDLGPPLRMDLQHVIATHGDTIYVIAFAWAFFEGETFVLFGGLAAAQGLLNPLILGACVAIGSFCGDQCWFQIGRRFGARLLQRYPRWQQRVEAPLGWLQRYDAWFILTFRFIYGIRNISSFALGISAVSTRRFMVLNLLGSALWATSFVSAGYLFGGVLGVAVGDLAQDLGLFMLGAFVLAIFATRLAQKRRARNRKPD
jgi:membrane protein DedA with SNARE-associated domain